MWTCGQMEATVNWEVTWQHDMTTWHDILSSWTWHRGQSQLSTTQWWHRLPIIDIWVGSKVAAYIQNICYLSEIQNQRTTRLIHDLYSTVLTYIFSFSLSSPSPPPWPCPRPPPPSASCPAWSPSCPGSPPPRGTCSLCSSQETWRGLAVPSNPCPAMKAIAENCVHYNFLNLNPTW